MSEISFEELQVDMALHALHQAVEDVIRLRHLPDTADLILLEADSIHADSAKLANLDADVWCAVNKQAAE